MDFKRTRLVQDLERERQIRSLPRWLQDRYREGWSYAEMADELSVSTWFIGQRIRELGYSTRQMAQLAWEQGLAPAIPYDTSAGDQLPLTLPHAVSS